MKGIDSQRDLPMWDAVVPTDITVADWLEVILAEGHEMPSGYPFTQQAEELWATGPLSDEALVTIVEIECLKRARRDAYLPAS